MTMSPSSKTCKFEKIEMMILIIGTGKKSKIGASLDNILKNFPMSWFQPNF